MNWSYLLTGFDGRIGRRDFWAGFAVLLGVELICHLAAYRIGGDRLGAIVDLAFIYFWFALFIKRANDRDLPTWLVGSFFALAFAMDFLVVVAMGLVSRLMLVFLVPYLVLALVLLVELGLRPGTPGRNRFGPDPAGRR